MAGESAPSAEDVYVDIITRIDGVKVKQAASGFDDAVSQLEKSAARAEKALEDLAKEQARHGSTVDALKKKLKDAQITQEQFNAELLKSKAALKQAETGYSSANNQLSRFNTTAAGAAMRSRQIGYQVSDIGSQLAVGTSPFIIMAQQSSQLANALEGTGGVLGRVAGFLSTWQGALLLAAASIAAQVLPKLIQFGSALDDEVEKLKEASDKTKLTKDAQAEFGRTVQGVTDAVNEQAAALDKLNKVQESAAETAYKNALNERQLALDTQKATIAALDKAQADLKIAISQPIGGKAGQEQASGQAALLSTQIKSLETDRDKIAADVIQAEANLNAARAAVAVERVTASDEDKIDRKYDEQIDTLTKATVTAQNLATQFISGEQQKAAVIKASNAELRKQVQAIEDARKAEQKALADSKKNNSQTGNLTTFITPVSGGRVTGKFGEQRPGHQHGGIDLAVPVGTAVKAAAGGTVIESGRLGNFGNVVIIDHGNGTITRYAHLSQLGVAKGATVDQGDQIGLSGGAKGAPGAGNSQGPHLHYEVRRNGKAVDPNSGPFPTDGAGELIDAQKAAAKAAKDEADRRQAFENELATLQGSEIDARQALITNAEDIAQLELDAIKIAKEKYDDNVDNLVATKKLTEDEGKQLKDINDERAKYRAELVQLREDLRKFRMQEADNQHAAQFADAQNANEAELLQGQEELVKTQKERREIERRLIELQYQEEKARNDYVIAYYERLKTQKGIAESELKEAEAAAKIAQLKNDSIDQRQAATTEKSDRSTAGPLQSYIDSIPSTADELNEALESVAAGGLQSLVDGLTDAIVHFKSLKDVGIAVLQTITGMLVKLALQQLLLKVIGQTAGAASVAATAAEAGAAATAWAPAAALASLATLGANAGPAAAALIGTNALSSGLALAGAAGLAGGGPVIGPGGPTSDNVPIRASNGEYMIRAKAASKLGRSALDRMNLTGDIPYAFGGPIGDTVRPTNDIARPSGGGGNGGAQSTLSPDSVRQLAGIVGDAIGAMPPVQLFPTLDPGKALDAALSSPGGQRTFFDFVSANPGKFKSALGLR